MANTVTKTPLHDGHNVGTVHIYLKSDGSSGELSDEVLIDASALAGAKPIKKLLSVEGVLQGFSLTLKFKETTSPVILELPADEKFCFDLRKIGSIKNPQGTGTTGDVVGTTQGFTAAADSGVITIKYRK